MLRSRIVSALLLAGANPDVVDECGHAPLHTAIENSEKDNLSALQISQLLIIAGANIELRAWMDKTPLLKACDFGNIEITTFLLEQGADPSAQADEWMNPGLNALDFANMGKNPHVISIVKAAIASHSQQKKSR